MILLNIVLLIFVALGAWWLTGIDKTPGGQSKHEEYLFRVLRCAAVVVLFWVFIWFMEWPRLSAAGIPLLLIIPVSIALLLRSSISELFAGGFLGLLDPALHDHREQDPKKARRYQDAIAHLIRNGQREQAIKLCEELKLSGEVDLVTLENTLEFLGVKPARAPDVKPLAAAGRLRTQGKFADAEQLLKSLLLKNPADDGAAMLLMRLYAQDLRSPDRAHEVLQALEKQPHVPADHLEFARRSIREWSHPQPPPLPPSVLPNPESIDDLLAQGSYGTAVETLKAQIEALKEQNRTQSDKPQPDAFDLQLKLAEVYALHCKNLLSAEKIVRQMELTSSVNPQQIALARAKLAEWHLAANSRQG
jgi:hypothetical protein